ncbi:MAG: permease prefix domain 1-containing protein [Psychroflexus sp.]
MEDRSEFNLERSINIWKLKLSEDSSLSHDNIEELENHLYDEIEKLNKLGLSPEESLIIAKKRIGKVDEIKREFGKINNNMVLKKKMLLYLKGILIFFAFITITDLLASITVIITHKIGINNGYLEYVSAGSIILIFSFLMIASFIKYKNSYLHRLTSIPVLVSTIIIGQIIYFLSFKLITDSISTYHFGNLNTNLKIFEIALGIIIITTSLLMNYSSKKDKKLKISS